MSCGLGLMMAWDPPLHGQVGEPGESATVIDFDREYTEEAEDSVACGARLRRIMEALDWYRRRHGGAVPESLSALLGGYLDDETILKCPYVERTGRSKGWRYGFRDEVWSDRQTSYAYEFSGSALPIYDGQVTTLHEYKRRQMALVRERGGDGGVVPIVRCFAHRPVLNLSYGGVVYPSDFHWEELPEIVKLGIDHHELIPEALFEEEIRTGMRSLDFPTRDPSCGVVQLDLGRHYNARLTVSWHPGTPGNDLSALPRGFVRLGEVRYDVRGVIQLKGTRLLSPFPERVNGIPVGQECRRIHFLHATAYRMSPGTQIGHYLIRYVDGAEDEIPILYGRDVEDWWFEPGVAGAGASSEVAWTGENAAARQRGRKIRLFHTCWDNPRGEVQIESLDFVSALTESGPFLVGVTIE
jgi:hypothetical protein